MIIFSENYHTQKDLSCKIHAKIQYLWMRKFVYVYICAGQKSCDHCCIYRKSKHKQRFTPWKYTFSHYIYIHYANLWQNSIQSYKISNSVSFVKFLYFGDISDIQALTIILIWTVHNQIGRGSNEGLEPTAKSCCLMYILYLYL